MNDNNDPMSAFTELADQIRRAAYADGWRDAMTAIAKAVGELAPGEVQDAIGPRAAPKLITTASQTAAKAKLTVGTTPYQIVQARRTRGEEPAGPSDEERRHQELLAALHALAR